MLDNKVQQLGHHGWIFARDPMLNNVSACLVQGIMTQGILIIIDRDFADVIRRWFKVELQADHILV